MTTEQTLSIVKPDAVGKNCIGEIIARLEKSGLNLVAAKMTQLTGEQAAAFYAVHKERPFYQELIDFMISGPVVVMVLEGENAVMQNRKVMGDTNPKNAEQGTIRADFADSIGENAVHGSDAVETAKEEIAFFFNNGGVCKRTR